MSDWLPTITLCCVGYAATLPLARAIMMECNPSAHTLAVLVALIVIATIGYTTTNAAIAGVMTLLALLGTIYMYIIEIVGPIPPRVDMRGKVIVVTGANSGIGLETTRQLAQMGATVIMGCRSLERSKPMMDDVNNDAAVRANKGKAVLLTASLDLNSLQSVRKWAKCLEESGYTALDALVCNAGLFVPSFKAHHEIINKGTADEKQVLVEDTFCSNHLGHHLLQHLCLPALHNASLKRQQGDKADSAPSRIVLVCSSLHKLASLEQGQYPYTEWPALRALSKQPQGDLPTNVLQDNYNQWVVYGATKLGEMLSARHFEKLLKTDPTYQKYAQTIHINTLHPGNPVTGVTANLPWVLRALEKMFYPFMFLYRQTCTLGAYNTVWTTTHPDALKTQNSYYVHCAPSPQNPAVYDDVAAKKIYEYSELLCQE